MDPNNYFQQHYQPPGISEYAMPHYGSSEYLAAHYSHGALYTATQCQSQAAYDSSIQTQTSQYHVQHNGNQTQAQICYTQMRNNTWDYSDFSPVPPPPLPPPTARGQEPTQSLVPDPPPPSPPHAIPPPPSSTIPPPPPPSISSQDDQYQAKRSRDDIAYSPTMVRSDDDNPPPPPPPIPKPPRESLEEIQAREEKARLEHMRRIEAENRKKRKYITGARVSGPRLKKMELNAFRDDDEYEKPTQKAREVSKEDDNVCSERLHTSLQRNTTDTLSDTQMKVIRKTAAWASNNSAKLHYLIEKSKGDDKMRFLVEPDTTAGRIFASELARLKAQEKNSEGSSLCGAETLEERREETLFTNIITGDKASTTVIDLPAHTQNHNHTGTTPNKPKRIRRSKWGPALTLAEENSTPTNKVEVGIESTDKRVGDINLPVQFTSTAGTGTTRDDVRAREQQEHHVLEQRISKASQFQGVVASDVIGGTGYKRMLQLAAAAKDLDNVKGHEGVVGNTVKEQRRC